MPNVRPWLAPAAITTEALAIGAVLDCGFLSFVIEDWFKCSYALWMIGAALVLLLFSGLLRHAGQLHGDWLRQDPVVGINWSRKRTHLLIVSGFLMVAWLVVEQLALSRVYHYAYAWSLRDPIWLALAPFMLTALGCGAAAMRARLDRPLWRVQDLPARLFIDSCVAGLCFFILMQPFKPVPATEHFYLPEVLGGFLVLSGAFVALDVVRLRKRGGAVLAEAKALYLRAEAGRFLAWVVVVGHLLPILLASRQLPVFDLMAAVAALIGVAHGHRLLLAPPVPHDRAGDFP